MAFHGSPSALRAIPQRLPVPSDYDKYGEDDINSAMKELTDTRLTYIEMEPELLLRLYEAFLSEDALCQLAEQLDSSSVRSSVSGPSSTVTFATGASASAPLLRALHGDAKIRARWLFAHEAATQLLHDVLESTGELHSSRPCLKLVLINSLLKHIDTIETQLEAGSKTPMKRKFVLELGSHTAPRITSRQMLS
jgi:hypothetical protein